MSAAKRPPKTKIAPPKIAPQPFVPRRGLFIALLIVMAGWIAALIVMYFKTVRR